MDSRLYGLARELRSKPAAEAVTWLLHRYPLHSLNWGEALTLIGHCSFPRKETRVLATYYLTTPAPHASGRAYVLFARLLGITGLLNVLKEIDVKPGDRDLLLYYLEPILREAKNKRDLLAVSTFMERTIPPL